MINCALKAPNKRIFISKNKEILLTTLVFSKASLFVNKIEAGNP